MYTLSSDGGLHLGGWTIDDFCIVAFAAGPAECGNDVLEGDEECDDGNTDDGDGCAADCTDEAGPGDPDGGLVDFPDAGANVDGDGDGGCGCRAGGSGAPASGAALAVLMLGAAMFVLRRRR
jgi:MYXO-CTERM domain-containing protein